MPAAYSTVFCPCGGEPGGAVNAFRRFCELVAKQFSRPADWSSAGTASVVLVGITGPGSLQLRR